MQTFDEILSELSRKKTGFRHYPFKKAKDERKPNLGPNRSLIPTEINGGKPQQPKYIDTYKQDMNSKQAFMPKSYIYGMDVYNVGVGRLPSPLAYLDDDGEETRNLSDAAIDDETGWPIRADTFEVDSDGKIVHTPVMNRMHNTEKDWVGASTMAQEELWLDYQKHPEKYAGRDVKAEIESERGSILNEEVKRQAKQFLESYKAEEYLWNQIKEAARVIRTKDPNQQMSINGRWMTWNDVPLDPVLRNALESGDLEYSSITGKFYPVFDISMDRFVEGMAGEVAYRNMCEENGMTYAPPDERAVYSKEQSHKTAMDIWARMKIESHKPDHYTAKQMQDLRNEFESIAREGTSIGERLYLGRGEYEGWAGPLLAYNQIYNSWYSDDPDKGFNRLKSLHSKLNEIAAEFKGRRMTPEGRARYRATREAAEATARSLVKMKDIKNDLETRLKENDPESDKYPMFNPDGSVNNTWLEVAKNAQSIYDTARADMNQYIKKYRPDLAHHTVDFERRWSRKRQLFGHKPRSKLGVGSKDIDSASHGRNREIGYKPSSEISPETDEQKYSHFDDLTNIFGQVQEMDAESALKTLLAEKELKRYAGNVPHITDPRDYGQIDPLDKIEQLNLNNYYILTEKGVEFMPFQEAVEYIQSHPNAEVLSGMSDKEQVDAYERYMIKHMSYVPEEFRSADQYDPIHMANNTMYFNPSVIAEMKPGESRWIPIPKKWRDYLTHKPTGNTGEKEIKHIATGNVGYEKVKFDSDEGRYDAKDIEKSYLIKKLDNGHVVIMHDPNQKRYFLTSDGIVRVDDPTFNPPKEYGIGDQKRLYYNYRYLPDDPVLKKIQELHPGRVVEISNEVYSSQKYGNKKAIKNAVSRYRSSMTQDLPPEIRDRLYLISRNNLEDPNSVKYPIFQRGHSYTAHLKFGNFTFGLNPKNGQLSLEKIPKGYTPSDYTPSSEVILDDLANAGRLDDIDPEFVQYLKDNGDLKYLAQGTANSSKHIPVSFGDGILEINYDSSGYPTTPQKWMDWKHPQPQYTTYTQDMFPIQPKILYNSEKNKTYEDYLNEAKNIIDEYRGYEPFSDIDFVTNAFENPRLREFFNPNNPQYDDIRATALRHAIYSYHPEFDEKHPLALDLKYTYIPKAKELITDNDKFREEVKRVDRIFRSAYLRYLNKNYNKLGLRKHPKYKDILNFEWFMDSQVRDRWLNPKKTMTHRLYNVAYNLNNPNIGSIENAALRSYLLYFAPATRIKDNDVFNKDLEWMKNNEDLFNPDKLWNVIKRSKTSPISPPTAEEMLAGDKKAHESKIDPTNPEFAVPVKPTPSPEEVQKKYDEDYAKYTELLTEKIGKLLAASPDLTEYDVLTHLRNTVEGRNKLYPGDDRYNDMKSKAYRAAFNDVMYKYFQDFRSIDFDKMKRDFIENTKSWGDSTNRAIEEYERKMKFYETEKRDYAKTRTDVMDTIEDPFHDIMQSLGRSLNKFIHPLSDEELEKERQLSKMKEEEQARKAEEYDATPWGPNDREEQSLYNEEVMDEIEHYLDRIKNVPEYFDSGSIDDRADYLFNVLKRKYISDKFKTSDDMRKSKKGLAILNAIGNLAKTWSPIRPKTIEEETIQPTPEVVPKSEVPLEQPVEQSAEVEPAVPEEVPSEQQPVKKLHRPTHAKVEDTNGTFDWIPDHTDTLAAMHMGLDFYNKGASWWTDADKKRYQDLYSNLEEIGNMIGIDMDHSALFPSRTWSMLTNALSNKDYLNTQVYIRNHGAGDKYVAEKMGLKWLKDKDPWSWSVDNYEKYNGRLNLFKQAADELGIEFNPRRMKDQEWNDIQFKLYREGKIPDTPITNAGNIKDAPMPVEESKPIANAQAKAPMPVKNVGKQSVRNNDPRYQEIARTMGIDSAYRGMETDAEKRRIQSYMDYLDSGNHAEPYVYTPYYYRELANAMNLNDLANKDTKDWNKDDVARMERLIRLHNDVVEPTANLYPVPRKEYEDVASDEEELTLGDHFIDTVPKKNDLMDYTPEELNKLHQQGLFDSGQSAPKSDPAELYDEVRDREYSPEELSVNRKDRSEDNPLNSRKVSGLEREFTPAHISNPATLYGEDQVAADDDVAPVSDSPAASDPAQSKMDAFLTPRGDNDNMDEALDAKEEPVVPDKKEDTVPTIKSSDEPEMMSLRDMFDAIRKSDKKDGHPYGKPIEGNVFAYGSTFSEMGDGKDMVMPKEIPAGKTNGEGATTKKIDI